MSLHHYTNNEDANKEETINKYKDILLQYEYNCPTLSKALNQLLKSQNLEDSKVDDLTNDILSQCEEHLNKNYNEINKKYNNISREDALTICAYTCECKERQYNTYKILNRNLVTENRKQGVKNISEYLYIFLKALRKLPRYKPNKDNKYLYRCIGTLVKVKEDNNNPQYVPYIKGNFKTFWGFTSTSIKPNYTFLEGEQLKSGTRFKLLETEKDSMWGYDITLFNLFGENEVILEPETKFKVDDVMPEVNGIIDITCEIMKTPLILDFIKVCEIKNSLIKNRNPSQILTNLQLNTIISNNINESNEENQIKIRERKKNRFIHENNIRFDTRANKGNNNQSNLISNFIGNNNINTINNKDNIIKKNYIDNYKDKKITILLPNKDDNNEDNKNNDDSNNTINKEKKIIKKKKYFSQKKKENSFLQVINYRYYNRLKYN